MKNFKAMLVLLVSSVVLIGCGGSDDNDTHAPQLRAVHLSPDAPAVDIEVGGAVAIPGVEYRQASKFLSVERGVNDIRVLVPALDNASALDASPNLEEDMKYTVIAANTVANGLPLTPIIVADDISAPADGNAEITVVHGSTAAQAAASSGVDVYVTAPNGELAEPTLGSVVFGAVSEELSVPAGDYRVRITPAGSTAVVYDSGTINLADGVEYVAIAADDIKTASLVGLTILTDLGSTPFVNVDNAVSPQLRAVHLSPDAPAVDIAVGGAVALSGVEYRQASGFLDVDSGATDISVLVPALNNDSALDARPILEDRVKYTVIAANTVANGLPLTPIIVADDVNLPASGNADITVVHGSTAAQAAAPNGVDVYVTAPGGALSNPVLEGISFQAVSDELSVPAGDYQVRITPTGTNTVVYNSGTVNLAAGVEYIAIASDDLNPANLVGLTILTDLAATPFVNVDNK